MIDKKNTLKLLNYINTPMSKESIIVLYNANNITYERCELYGDVIISLILIVFDTYMGDDITNEIERKNHFKWCWNKNLENFKKEGIEFDNDKLYKYFYQFMWEVYYPINGKDENLLNNITKLWVYIFDYNNTKSKSDMDTMIEVYILFQNSLK